MNNQLAERVWADVREIVKDNVMSPSIFEALEKAIPIDIRVHEFILGFSSADSLLSGYIRAASIKPLIERYLSEAMREEMKLVIVEASTIDEYEKSLQLHEMAKAAVGRSTGERSEQRKIENYWEEVGEKCTRGFAKCENRSFNTTKSDFMITAFGFVNVALTELDYDNNKTNLNQRCLSRVFDKLGNSLELPGAILAYLFFDWRKNNKNDSVSEEK